MKIKWYAHACLRLEGDGVSIITDPYTPHKSGFAPVLEPADIVVRSSDDDSAHGNAAMIPGNPLVVTATHILGSGQTARGVHFRAIPAKESMRVKLQPRDNAMYRFALDGVQVAHLGDVGNPLEPWQLEALAGVDVVIAPTGGPPTIELADLWAALDVLQPKVTIPMHYQLPGCKFPRMADVTDFTDRYPAQRVRWMEEPVVAVSTDGLPSAPEVWVLQATTAG